MEAPIKIRVAIFCILFIITNTPLNPTKKYYNRSTFSIFFSNLQLAPMLNATSHILHTRMNVLASCGPV